MNERIKELFEQAHITTTRQVIKGGWDNDRPPYEMVSKTTTEFDPEVFARLIAQDCISIVEKQKERLCEEQHHWSEHDFGYEMAVNDAGVAIKQHFGVKE